MSSHILVIIFGLLGFITAATIRHKKKIGQPLVCPLNSNCESVVYSSYSKFFGIDVTTLGVGYYGAITTFYIFLFVAGPFLPGWVMVVGFFVTLLAVIFSVYLLIIQFLVIKEWCFWCIVSAIISLMILVSSGYAVGPDLLVFLGKYKSVIVILHALAAALGMGTVLVTDVFFMKFLQDYQISESEADVLNTLSQIVWFALALLIISGVGLFLPTTAAYLIKTKFLAKVIVVGVIVVNGVLLNLLIAPKLVKISFHEETVDHPGQLHHLRKMAFAFGAVSIVSWLTTFILGSVRTINLSTGGILGIYLFIIVIAVIGSQYFDHRFVHPRHTKNL